MIKSSVLEILFQKTIGFIQEPENMTKLDTYIISPLINHLFQKIFPYLVLTGVVFLLLIVMMLMILGILLINFRGATIDTYN